MQRRSRSSRRFRSIAAPMAARDHHAERERLFSAAVESSNDAIITMSLDGTITGWNSAAERLFGYSAAEAVGKNITLLVPDDRLPEIQDALRRIGWGESIEHNETVRLRKDGSRIEVSLSISPIKSPSGATIGISKVARDITEANKTRQVLRQQTEELRRIFETSQDLIMVMDSQGISGSDQPELRNHTGLSAGGNDRPQRRRLHPSRPSREIPRGNARGAARAAPEDFRYALHSQGRAGGVAVLARDMVRAGQALLLRRPRHDREPAGAGDACAKASSSRAASSTPRSTPSSRSTSRASSGTGTRRPKISSAGRATKRSARTAFDLIGPPDGQGPLKTGLRALPALRRRRVRQPPPRTPGRGGATARRSRPN